MNVRNSTIILEDCRVIVLKVEFDSHPTLYFMYSMSFGQWYEVEGSFDRTVCKLALNYHSAPVVEPLWGPVDNETEMNIRDRWLVKAWNDNFILFNYRDHHIWFGYNDTSDTGHYFVSDLDEGCDDGISHSTIREARYHIDKIFEGE